MAKNKARRSLHAAALALFLVAALYFTSGALLAAVGRFLVLEEQPVPSQAIVVLSTGVEYYPRLIEAARLFRSGYGEKVVIDGNRKSDALRELERKGFRPCCPWHEDSLRVLSLLGVPRDRVIAISAEDAYDTVSEARAVGENLLRRGLTRILITTSKYHTRRARYIWERSFPKRFSLRVVAAQDDPYSPAGWWRQGRQIRWVLEEYGGWLYDFWKEIRRME